jgi:molybdate transport system substrate-binding protein
MPLSFSLSPAALILSVFFSNVPAYVMAGHVTVFASSSLTDAGNALAEAWENETGHIVNFSFAGASILSRQIQLGAPADIFISASADWMDALEKSGDLRAGTRRDILGNTLVLIAHGSEAPLVELDETLDLAMMLGNERLAMALVDAVPAGIYGKAALTSLGLWQSVEPLVAQSDNVRSALAFVALNEAPFGIVYATDAMATDNVSIVGIFPRGSHAPILYPAAITAQSTSPFADTFMEFLTSETARDIWERHGFSVLE